MITISNPILSGFYPDPSICRVGDDFYLVNSSFAYFPGVPIFHSKDMAHWEQIGNILDRNSQLPLKGCGHSQGIFAPTIRYFNGIFYMITTNVSGGGNFIVTTKNPKGPWSEPYFLGEDATGIDPSLFFDEDGSCYYVGTRPNPKGVRYNGDWEIWVSKLDLQTMKLTGENHKIWKGALNNVIWPEGPHLYQKNGYYYVMIAEGGTGPNHSITVARSKEVMGTYENNPNNPILTHRHLGSNYPIIYVGHGDLVDDEKGNWYMIMLASRPCEGFTNLGRETFLAKVIWENDWPVVNPGIGKLEEKLMLPGEAFYKLPRQSTYHFMNQKLDDAFVMLRNPEEGMYNMAEREGYLRMRLYKDNLKKAANPAYIGVRQQGYYYQSDTLLDFTANQDGEEAGIAVLQSNLYHIRFGKIMEHKEEWLIVALCENGTDTIISKQKAPRGKLELRIINRGQKADFYYRVKEEFLPIASGVDMYKLSTEVAGGFTGCTIGMYASSNGWESVNYADFGWFSYETIKI
ncbi:glycoside hydrolase family 43 protein [Lachnotalea glycerini]|uniref:Glycoside hydrolase family 43 protein n=1 Tax=Lachnotalea glycerini TaxID=1763509 RepID=A0A371JFE5_9FIRM|nr:glycoside hydrolase family 43 protein [Lachnotalea glycerini]RDY31445.1 glycoside hydrolase family 43 protein [Lachnotalea glycerini]